MFGLCVVVFFYDTVQGEFVSLSCASFSGFFFFCLRDKNDDLTDFAGA